MHLLLTDRLACPRCGPRFGLVLMADRMAPERRVLDGFLGCPNCRDRFPIVDGFGDLRAPPRGARPVGRAGRPAPADPAMAERLQALLGIVEGPGTVAAVGAAARHAGALAERIEGIGVVAVDADVAAWPEVAGVSRMMSRPGLPIFDATLRGVVVDGGLGPDALAEAVRVVAPRARVVVTDAAPDAASVLEEHGAKVLAAESGTVVAARG